jgi:hypothetical protein
MRVPATYPRRRPRRSRTRSSTRPESGSATCRSRWTSRSSSSTASGCCRAAGQLADFFKQAGYAPLTPDWRDNPETVEGARAALEILAMKTLKQVADHTTEIINALG